MLEFTDINKSLPKGQNMGGLTQEIYYGFHADVLTWPTAPVDATTLAANAVLTGELAMKSGKKLFKMYITDDTGEFMIEPVGELDGKSFVTHLTVFHPGLKDTILALSMQPRTITLYLWCRTAMVRNISWVTSSGQLFMQVLLMDLVPEKKRQQGKVSRWNSRTRQQTCISIPGIFL